MQLNNDGNSSDIVEEVLNDDRKKGGKEDQEEKPPAVEPEEDITQNAVVQIHNCDVMIGLFRCIVDLYFQNDRMCMRNVRGKHDAWPFKSSYMFDFKHLRDVRYACLSLSAVIEAELIDFLCGCRLYKVSKDAENEVVDSEQMEQLLGEASYVAFKLPLLEETEQDAVKTFYDPADDGTWFDL